MGRSSATVAGKRTAVAIAAAAGGVARPAGGILEVARAATAQTDIAATVAAAAVAEATVAATAAAAAEAADEAAAAAKAAAPLAAFTVQAALEAVVLVATAAEGTEVGAVASPKSKEHRRNRVPKHIKAMHQDGRWRMAARCGGKTGSVLTPCSEAAMCSLHLRLS